MNFDYTEREWRVGKGTFLSQPSIGAWELALYNEKLQAAVEESPLGETLPPKNSPKYAKALVAATMRYLERYTKYSALIACEVILTPAPGSCSFEQAIEGLDIVTVTTQLAPVIIFFFENVKDSIPNAPTSPKTGKASKAIRPANR